MPTASGRWQSLDETRRQTCGVKGVHKIRMRRSDIDSWVWHLRGGSRLRSRNYGRDRRCVGAGDPSVDQDTGTRSNFVRAFIF